jgi:hypothetical protein
MSRRLEPAVQYKRLIKRTLVAALRTVFSEQYPDPQLRNLYISTDHPLKREQFPAIIINYEESSVSNAGVGHIEEILNDDFLTVPLKHFRFQGKIRARCFALSPLDRDILSDSLVELLAFGRLDLLLNKFFDVVYSDISDSAQISLHSDYLSSTGESTSTTLWNAEDVLIYETGYVVDCSGGFYSTMKTDDITDYINNIIVYGNEPFDEEQEKLLDLFSSNSSNPFYVNGRGIASSE